MAVCGHVRGPRPSRSHVQDRELWHTNALPVSREVLGVAVSSGQQCAAPTGALEEGASAVSGSGGGCKLIQVSGLWQQKSPRPPPPREALRGLASVQAAQASPVLQSGPQKEAWEGDSAFQAAGRAGRASLQSDQVNRTSASKVPRSQRAPPPACARSLQLALPGPWEVRSLEAGPASLGRQGLRELLGSGHQPRGKVPGGGAWPIRGRRRRRRCSACPWWWGAPRGSA